MKKILLCFIFILTLLISGCQSKMIEVVVKEKPVTVETLKTTINPVELTYMGYVEPAEIKKYAFLAGGTIDRVEVGVGDEIIAGQILAVLNSDKQTIASDSSYQQKRAALQELEKAKEAYNYYGELLSDTKALVEVGAGSMQQLEDIQFRYDIAGRELSQAQANYNQASLQTQYSEDTVEDTVLVSDMDGLVLEVFNKSGELVSPGYPVVLVRGHDTIVKVGLTSTDVKKLKVGDSVEVLAGSETFTGSIGQIDMMPDEVSRTYAIEIDVNKGSSLLLGEVVTVVLASEKQEGIWIYMSHILNDGRDYVYVVENDRAMRRDITLLSLYKDKVLVEGLSSGETLVVGGTNTLSDGYKVHIVGEEDE